jgi:hypothetical protein
MGQSGKLAWLADKKNSVCYELASMKRLKPGHFVVRDPFPDEGNSGEREALNGLLLNIRFL